MVERASLRLAGRTLTADELYASLRAGWWWGRRPRRPVDLRPSFVAP